MGQPRNLAKTQRASARRAVGVGRVFFDSGSRLGIIENHSH